MNNQNRRISEMATRMRIFKAAHESDFPANSIGGQRFAQLDDLVEKIDLYGTQQAQERGAAKAITEAKGVLREEIIRQMKAIRETAISVEAQQPGISQNFLMPASKSNESLIEAARAFVATATPLKPLFLSREMPENFLEVLTNTIQSFEEAVNNHNTHIGNRSAARMLVDEVCSQVIELRRELYPIVRNKYQNDPEKLALWETASHLERPSRSAAAKKPGSAPPPPAGGQG